MVNVWRLLRNAFDVGTVLLDDSGVTTRHVLIRVDFATMLLINELY